MKQYERIFIFLIKIKLAKSLLNDCWKEQMRGRHRTCVFIDIQSVSQIACILRHSMYQLLQILESYFMFDVLETAWKKFQIKVSQTSNMDGLILAHKEYVVEMIRKLFLCIADEQKLHRPLQDIIDQISQFTTMYNQLSNDLSSISHRRNQFMKYIASNSDSIDLNDEIMFKLFDDANSSSVSNSVSLNHGNNNNNNNNNNININSSNSGSSKQLRKLNDEYCKDYESLRQTQNQIVYILKSFHNKVKKLLELSKLSQRNNDSIGKKNENLSSMPDHLERLLVNLDFNDFHTNLSMTLNETNAESSLMISMPFDQQQSANYHILDLPVNPPPINLFINKRESIPTETVTLRSQRMSSLSSKTTSQATSVKSGEFGKDFNNHKKTKYGKKMKQESRKSGESNNKNIGSIDDSKMETESFDSHSNVKRLNGKKHIEFSMPITNTNNNNKNNISESNKLLFSHRIADDAIKSIDDVLSKVKPIPVKFFFFSC